VKAKGSIRMSDLLKLAENYQQEHNWSKAVYYFDQYMKDNKQNCSADVYIAYAKCLRFLGEVCQAEELLGKGRTLYSKNEKILEELIHIYAATSNYDKEISVAKALIQLKPKKASYYFRLGKAYASAADFKEAERNYIIGLEHKHKMTIEELIEKIQSGFAENTEEVTSKYHFISGRSNYGSFIHTHGDKKYFTKISRNDLLAQREEMFYKDLCVDFPELEKVVPAYIHSIVINNIIYLTIEMIDGDSIDSNRMKEILLTSQYISSIPYASIIEKYPNPAYNFQLKNKPNPVTIFFTEIHQKYYNERMFSLLYKLIKQNHYPTSIMNIIERLETLVMENELYAFITPEKHYSLIHGDLNQSNVKVDKQNQSIKTFDWETFKIGLRTVDVARHLSSKPTPYSKVKEIYLDDEELGGKLSLIEKIFFLYILILMNILTFRQKNIEKSIEQYVLPALDDMEQFVSQLKENEYAAKIGQLLNKVEEDQIKIKNLNQKITKLKKKNSKLEKSYKNLLNSKSWKITAPLRKVGELFKRKN